MINITVTVPVCEIGEYPEEYTPVAAAHSNKLTTEQREADALRAGLFAANVRVEELERLVDDLRGELAQSITPDCVPAMSIDEALSLIPGGARINDVEGYVESMIFDSNGEGMHEDFGYGVTCVEAILKLHARIKKAMESERDV